MWAEEEECPPGRWPCAALVSPPPTWAPEDLPALTCGISSSLSHTLRSTEEAVMETQVNAGPAPGAASGQGRGR